METTVPPRTARRSSRRPAGLAAAMGIGRFAFTPLLPLMQARRPGPRQGAWLAAANYLGYRSARSRAAPRPPPPQAARGGLVAVALLTLAMGVDQPLRRPGSCCASSPASASACVLVGVSAWALAALGARGQRALVGRGVRRASASASPSPASPGWSQASRQRAGGVWLLLGALQRGARRSRWRALPRAGGARGEGAGAALDPTRGDGGWSPATARSASATSSRRPSCRRSRASDRRPRRVRLGLAGVRRGRRSVDGAGRALPPPRRRRALWAASQLVMAAGVLAPALLPDLARPAGLRGVRRRHLHGGDHGRHQQAGVSPGRAPRLMAAMTAAFALGQLVGPLSSRCARRRAPAARRGPSVFGPRPPARRRRSPCCKRTGHS